MTFIHAVLISAVAGFVAPLASAQDQDIPTRREICDTLMTYRGNWPVVDAVYTVNIPVIEMSLRDAFAYDCGRIFIDRTVETGSGDEVSVEHYKMCFDGERSFTVTPRAGKADGVLILPGFDREFVDVSGNRCVLGAWLYEFQQPLDEVLRDPAWELVALERGEDIRGHPTVYLELTQAQNVQMIMRYWLGSDLDYLPVRRQLLTDDGTGEHLLNQCDVLLYEWVRDGHFPMKIEWSSGDVILSRMNVERVGKEPGVFDRLFASMVTPPANVTDTVNDKIYQLVSDDQFEDIGHVEDDTVATEQLAAFLEGVEPEIAEQVRHAEEQHRERRAAARVDEDTTSSSRIRIALWAGGGVFVVGGLGWVGWWFLQRTPAG